MELYKQIKRYRTDMNLSQEELAEKIYVTRQTISNWENDKSYPDIHSLLLLSSTFHISLDQLIKGDITTMKEEISKEAIQKFNRDGAIFTVLLILTVIAAVPLAVFLGYCGYIVWGILFLIMIYYALRVEKFKKENDIMTYKEIVAFTEGKQLDEIEKAQEKGKRPYQQLLSALLSATIVNNPVPVSLLSGDRKPQIRFLGNHPSGSGNLYHKSFRM